jgi:phosphoadenosine phosphosulfate reductase
MEHLEDLENLFSTYSLEVALRAVADLFPNEVKFSSALGQEDQLLTHCIATNKIPIEIFTIDTGRLFYETYNLLDITTEKYKIPIAVFFPNTNEVENMVAQKGINLFYNSVDNRQACCNIRKVEPLNRALANTKVWITGLRAEQNDFRKNLPIVEWLAHKNMYKINPLLHYSYDELVSYLQNNNVPFNKLHQQGFVSIGCAPCTRAIEPGEDARAGRWWWENSQKECGLHTQNN